MDTLPYEDVFPSMVYDLLIFERILAIVIRTQNRRRFFIDNFNMQISRNASLAELMSCKVSFRRELFRQLTFTTNDTFLQSSQKLANGGKYVPFSELASVWAASSTMQSQPITYQLPSPEPHTYI
jgi:hypothetical protein